MESYSQETQICPALAEFPAAAGAGAWAAAGAGAGAAAEARAAAGAGAGAGAAAEAAPKFKHPRRSKQTQGTPRDLGAVGPASLLVKPLGGWDANPLLFAGHHPRSFIH